MVVMSLNLLLSYRDDVDFNEKIKELKNERSFIAMRNLMES
jgi:hypothetical protein